jgi:hypothetical protein
MAVMAGIEEEALRLDRLFDTFGFNGLTSLSCCFLECAVFAEFSTCKLQPTASNCKLQLQLPDDQWMF